MILSPAPSGHSGSQGNDLLGCVLVNLAPHVLVQVLWDPGRGVAELIGHDLDVNF
jgi:hypothetical protein